ncbi:DEAD/DEAH box helicase [Variovorax robiniae]|uniref:DEAD/DEAH box helicase n=1 Tax=Variovorax robiniae TaxID=1836199 RepID=A0ABU8X2T2_9BURK
MTDAFEVQGEFAPVQSASASINDFAPAESHSDITLLDTLDVAAEEQVETAPKAPNGFIRLGLAQELIAAVADLGYDQPTTVQDKVIPLAMGSNDGASKFIDLMVSSQTGSGKTAAFLLPVLHTLLKQEAEAAAAAQAEFQRQCDEAIARGEAPPKKAKRKDPTSPRNFKAATPGALILCPTRELAQQVAHDAIDLVRHCRGLRVASVVGGMPYQLQIAKLQNANLVVATPGRLLDLQRSMQIKLDQVQFLVVDEADRMLDLGFADDLAEVNQLTIERKQTMMFSATFAPRIQQLAARVMRAPQKVQIDSPQEKHANIKQSLYWADNMVHKRKMLDHWLRDTTINQAIVFASTQVECDGLANDLQQDGFSAVALHGALSQGLRNRRLMALRQGQVQILVATDVAARGIDVPTITHVFNFGLPMKAEDYTHRIGRTGRAGRDGIAVTFAEFRDRRKIMDIEHYSHQNFKAETIPGLEPQQRMPQSRPQGFGGGRDRGDSRDFHSRDRKFGGGNGGGHRGGPSGGYAGASGFNDRGARPPMGAGAPRGFGGGHNAGFGGDRDRGGEGNYGRKPGWGDNAAPRGNFGGGGRNEGFGGAPRGHGGGGKVFVPRDAQQKRGFKPSR